MSSHNDSFAASGNSPTDKSVSALSRDFRLENHGSIFLLVPLSVSAQLWLDEHIGKENGYQPYWPTVTIEHRFIADIVAGIQDDGLAVG